MGMVTPLITSAAGTSGNGDIYCRHQHVPALSESGAGVAS